MNTENILQLRHAEESEEIAKVFEAAIEAVNSGTAKTETAHYYSTIVIDTHYIDAPSLLEFHLPKHVTDSFDADKEWDFITRLLPLNDWIYFYLILTKWLEIHLRDKWMILDAETGKWIPNPKLNLENIPSSLFDFACRIAIADKKLGPVNWDQNEGIFDTVELLGSTLPARLKKEGTGTLPADLASGIYDGAHITANDAMAIVSIEITTETASAYKAAIQHITRLLSTTDFPRSYWIQYRGRGKELLPIKDFPHVDVHRFFATAVTYPQTHPFIEEYARIAFSEQHFYADPLLDGDYYMAPGTFAVFCLAWIDQKYSPILFDYLFHLDGEHQQIHTYFVRDYLLKYGPTPEALAALCIATANCEVFDHDERFPSLISNERAIKTLLFLLRASIEAFDPKVAEVASLAKKINRHRQIDEYAPWAVRYALWGQDGETGGKRTIATAPEDLRPLYETIFSL
ncbi:MAG: DUF6138 family protein [Actinomycetaceae bacterium]|nr:DUF6138 family protein [Actinomycetaceae bacterium]